MDYLVNSYPNRGLDFVRGEGHELIDAAGERYLDLGSNYGVSLFGYGQEGITQALRQQLESLVSLHGSFACELRRRAAKMLVERCVGKMKRVFFSNSGSEAVEAALKFTRLASGKTRFVAMRNGYHGKTLGALSATSGERYRAPYLPLLWDFVHVTFGDMAEMQRAVTPETAAVILEPVQGEGGIRLASPEYCAELQRLCDEKGVLLIVDEIQTGLGRTGTFLAGEQFGLRPDILCLGKGLAGGIPIGATLVSEPVSRAIPVQNHTSTFGGNPLAMAGVCATLNELSRPGLMGHIRITGQRFLSGLQRIRHPKVVEARGLGLMLAMELTENATSSLKALQKRHIVAIPAGANTLRFLPPLTLRPEEVDFALRALEEIFPSPGGSCVGSS
jgi:acetylornithine/LysW-gamma-L-lysine aminotransferase